MSLLSSILGSYEDRDPAETGPADRATDSRDGSQRSLTLSLRVEVRESGRLPAQAPAHLLSGRRRFGGGRLARLRTALLRGIAETAQFPPPGSGQPPQPTPAAGGHPEATRSAMVNFWAALTEDEQEDLKSVASIRTFAAGGRIMREGDQADHVMVIIEGRARICVDENGWERVLAERGPGQLIGERGGLQVRVRSASVIALDAVRVLMAATEDFTAFVKAHPRVFDIVESQLYDRLTQAPAESRERGEPSAVGVRPDRARPATARGAEAQAVEDAQPPPGPLSGQNCTVLFSDVVAFSSRDRNDVDRLIIRRALFDITGLVLHGVPGAWSQDRGDGLLTVIPPSVPTASLIALLHTKLPAALDRHNSASREPTRFRLRIAINVGPVTTDALGVSGSAIIIAARLLAAPVFKEAIVTNAASLGIIASPFVYDTVITQNLNPVDVAGYSQVPVDVKESATAGWMKLIGVPSSYSSPADVSNSYRYLLAISGPAASCTGPHSGNSIGPMSANTSPGPGLPG